MRALLRLCMPYICVLPAYLWQLYFLCIPLFFILSYSILSPDVHLTMMHYSNAITWPFMRIVYNSICLSCITGICTLICAYPIAYYLAFCAGRAKRILLLLLILPSWTSFIIQVYAWFFVLQRNGLLSTLLVKLHIVSQPVSFLHTSFATVLGMVNCFLPFMIFPLYNALERMDKKLLEASADLGASWWQTFLRIIVPLSIPGIRVGMLLVMIPAFGEFAVPDLMGGGKRLYLGRLIAEKFLLYRDWYTGAAMVILSILFPLLLLGVMYIIRRVLSSKGRYGE